MWDCCTSIAVQPVRLLYKSVACGSLNEGDANASAKLAEFDYMPVLKVVVLEDYLQDWSWAIDGGLEVVSYKV